MWFLFVIGGILVGTAFCILRAFVLFDRLLGIEYERYHHCWVMDGRPIGFFWVPEGSSTLAGSFSRASVAMTWLFITPEWIADEPKGRALLTRMRRHMTLGWVGSFSILPVVIGRIVLA
jgi:hypothetical protein